MYHCMISFMISRKPLTFILLFVIMKKTNTGEMKMYEDMGIDSFYEDRWELCDINSFRMRELDEDAHVRGWDEQDYADIAWEIEDDGFEYEADEDPFDWWNENTE